MEEFIENGDVEVVAQIIPQSNTTIISKFALKSDEIYDISEESSEEDNLYYRSFKPYTKSLLEFLRIDLKDKYTINRFFKAIGEVSSLTGVFIYADLSSYCFIDPTRIGNSITLLKDKFAWERITTFIENGTIQAEGDTLQKKIAFLKNKPGVIGQIRMVFNPHEVIFRKNTSNIVEINLFKPTEIMLKAQQERADKGVLKDFSWLKDFPSINILLDNLCVEEERKFFFLNWLSYCMNIMKKAGTAFIFKGIQGTGKNVLFEQLISYFFGSQCCPTMTNEDITSRFTSPKLAEALFVCYNEVKCGFSEGNTSYEKLKTHITEDTLRIERKGMDSITVQNHFNAIFFSNNSVPLQIQTSDRRYTVFGTNDERLETVVERDRNMNMNDFFKEFFEKRDDFLCHLYRFDFDEKKAKTPMPTDEKLAIQMVSDSKQNQFSLGLQHLDNEFFENIFVKTIEAWQSSKQAQECIEFILDQTGKIDINPSVSFTVAKLEDFLHAFQIYFVTSIRKNGGYAPVGDIKFLLDLYYFDDKDLEKSYISSNKAAQILNHDFGQSMQMKYISLSLSLDEKEVRNQRVRSCNAWKRLVKNIELEEQEQEPDVNEIFPG